MTTLAGYQILFELNRGGMGRVLLARRQGVHGFERLVAIKTIVADMREQRDVRSMFVDEARLMARLHHPAIAQVFDLVEHEGELCLVMEYVAGVSFESLSAMRPPPRACAEAIIEALRGLHAAHELTLDGELLGVVHRDVSPQNLMLSFEGRVKILDFGIAWMRRRSAPMTELGTVKGKPAYMAPEQLEGKALDRRTDVYATAVVLHELLTGEPLFEGVSPFEVAHAIATGRVAPPSARAGPLPAELDALVLKGLARDPRERFETAEAMARALEGMLPILEGESLEAWARRELAQARAAHDTMLTSPADGRPTGVATVAGPLEARVDTDVSASLPVVSRSRRALAALIVASLLIALGLMLPRWLERAPAVPVDTAEAPPSIAPPPAQSTTRAIGESLPPVARVAPSKLAVPPPVASSHASAAPSAIETEHGFLTVGAEPYALVELDGTSLGPTPIFGRPVPAGPHTVVLVRPDTGTVRLSRSVRVEPGKTVTVHAR